MGIAKRSRVVIGASALATLTALGGLATAPATAQPDPNSNAGKLMSVLPKGFDSNNCWTSNDPATGSTTTIPTRPVSVRVAPTTAGRNSLH